jgi:hypothetical protein
MDPSDTARKSGGAPDTSRREVLKQQHTAREQQKSVQIMIEIMFMID